MAKTPRSNITPAIDTLWFGLPTVWPASLTHGVLGQRAEVMEAGRAAGGHVFYRDAGCSHPRLGTSPCIKLSVIIFGTTLQVT